MLVGASPWGCKRALVGVGPSLGGLEWVLGGGSAEARQLTGTNRDGIGPGRLPSARCPV